MLGYINHAIIGEKLSDELINEVEYRFTLNPKKLATYAIAQEMISVYPFSINNSKSIEKEEKFIINLIEYIKENNLSLNVEVMSFLYGQISHFIMEKLFASDKKNKKSLDMYIYKKYIKEIDEKDILKILSKKINDSNVKVAFCNAYSKAYGVSNPYFRYQFGRNTLKLLKGGYTLCNKKSDYEYFNDMEITWYDKDGKKDDLSSGELVEIVLETILDLIYASDDFIYSTKEKDIMNSSFSEILKDVNLSHIEIDKRKKLTA